MSLEVVGVLAALGVLVTLDGGFAGFRDAAGRSVLLDKRRMVARNVLRGVGLAWRACAVCFGAIALTLLVAPDPTHFSGLVVDTAQAMLLVYGPYAALVLSALLVYAVPHPDVSALATVLVLGPFTLARPVVVLAGLALALRQGDWRTATISLLGCGLVLAFGRRLDRHWRHRHPLDAHLR